MNPMTVPADPADRVKYWLSLLEGVRAQLKSGDLKDWGITCDNAEGYCFADTDEKTLHATVVTWLPYIQFDIRPVIGVDEVIAHVKSAAAAAKK
ncbi:MAG: hypothetical protein MUE45_00590 [Methanoregulaceae archaeon]|jgi:hypothetical protein|nr:hypothetical protein [Methanoregulaceae archaeon]